MKKPDADKNLKGLTLPELENWIADYGEQRYRGRQIFRWLYDAGATSFEEMTNLSKELRSQLSEVAVIEGVQCLSQQKSRKDRSVKFLFGLPDGNKIESVLMFENKRATLCISTQVGCAIDCKFCATGMMGLTRNLDAGEIVDQVLQVQKWTGVSVTNIVCMGMGEPFHNYDHLMKACGILTEERGLNLSSRRIVVSTSGLVPKIYQFADENHRYRLAISLNATEDTTRSRIMPLNKKWPIHELLQAAKYYTQKSEQRVTFEYALMAGVNDTLEDAGRLRKLVSEIRCKINLIPYNPTRGAYRRPSEERILSFYHALAELPAPVTIRWSKGEDIEAACGQLAVMEQAEPSV